MIHVIQNYWAPLAAAGVLAVLLLITSGLFWRGHNTKKQRAKFRKHFEDQQVFEAKSYDELKEIYYKAREKLAGKWLQYEVIDIIHDLSDNMVGRDDLGQRITYDIAFSIAERIRAAKEKEIIVILHTLGGYAFPSEKIAEALGAHPKATKVYVPYVAMSGGTIVALAAKELYMGKTASLGPIDAQFGPFPADAYERLIKDKPREYIADQTLLTSYVVEKYERDARDRAADLLNPKFNFDWKNKKKPKRRGWFARLFFVAPKPKAAGPKERANLLAIVDKFMNKDLFHGAKISAKKAESFGVPVAGDCPDDVYTLLNARLRMAAKSNPPPPPPGAVFMLAPGNYGMPTIMHEAPGAHGNTTPIVPPANSTPPTQPPKD